jgi:hypothetical protein
MTVRQESKIREMGRRICQHQIEEAKKAHLTGEETARMVASLANLTAVTCDSLAIVPAHLCNLTMRFFLEEQEAAWDAQERIGAAVSEDQAAIYMTASDQVRKQQKILAQEKVSDVERGLVSLALFMMNMYVIQIATRLPKHTALLFVRLAIEQFKEMIVIYNVGEN